MVSVFYKHFTNNQFMTCFDVKQGNKENPYWLAHLVSIMIAKRFLVAIDIARNVSKVPRQLGLKDKNKNVYLLSISLQRLRHPMN